MIGGFNRFTCLDTILAIISVIYRFLKDLETNGQAGIFPANPQTLFVGNSQSHRKFLRICIKFLKNLMNIVFKVHLKVYKWKISTIILNLQMFQG